MKLEAMLHHNSGCVLAHSVHADVFSTLFKTTKGDPCHECSFKNSIDCTCAERFLITRSVKDSNAIVNSDFVKNEEFIEACKKAGVEPTARQAGKYQRKTGTAYQHRNI